jgi:hypothetical protein
MVSSFDGIVVDQGREKYSGLAVAYSVGLEWKSDGSMRADYFRIAYGVSRFELRLMR